MGDLDLPYIEGIRLEDYFLKSFEKSLTNESLGPKVTTSKRRNGETVRHLTEGNEIMKNQINKLSLSWSTSKGRDTYGCNICRLDDRNNGRRFKCMGGGYDMVGTVFGKWLEANYQDELIKIDAARFYGANIYEGKIELDGACGLECMTRIAGAIGLEVERDYIEKGRRRGETIGWFVQMKKA